VTLARDSVNPDGLNASNLVRVVATALVLSTLSFAVGVAGDLSDPPNYGERVVLRLPPAIPADAPRAGPLQPLLVTASAEALPVQASRQRPLTFEAAYLEPISFSSEVVALAEMTPDPRYSAFKPDPRRKGA
jgi:hypothetical protein